MPFPVPVIAATGPVPVSSPCRLLHLPPQDWQPFNLPPKGRRPLLLAGTPILVPPQGRQKPYLSSNCPLCFLQGRQQHSFPFQRPASPSFASDKLRQSASDFSPSIWQEFCKNSARVSSFRLLKRGIDFFGKLSQIKGATLQEKEEKMDVEDYIHVKIISNIVEEPTYDDYSSTKEPAMVENWVIRFEQSMNVFLTDSVIKVLDLFYSDRHYARFFVLETIARVPYFAFISVLHMYESFGWWRRADYLKVHFAESWNELHHLLIMEELGGNALWFDRFLAQHIAIFYYFMTVFMYALSPRMAYHLSECVEKHAYSTYDKFLKLHGEELKNLPAPQVAIEYYMNEDMYLFDEFQTSRTPNSRRPEIENLYDVFLNVRDDEGEHCKTMRSCQTHGNLRSPHSNYARPQDVECAVHTADCEGFLDCFKKSLVDSK